MITWSRTLDAAGVTDTALRADYTAQRRAATRFRPEAAWAVRLLVPPALVPHVLVATAFMHHTDKLLDGEAPQAERLAEYRAWSAAVTAALAREEADEPLLRALAHSAALHPPLRRCAQEFLATAQTELTASGFATEADYQAYLDDYSLPALMVVACLLAPDTAEVRTAARAYIDGSQRLDFVADLGEDLAAGRLGLPLTLLAEHGVSRAELVAAAETPGTRALLRHALRLAGDALDQGRAVLPLTPPAHRALLATLIGLDELTARAAAEAGPAALLRSGAGPAKPAALALLWRQWRAARRVDGEA
ncbi:phytoene/squalene synthase family protein [Streptacidiphilus rugosus]|uniref:phytoene/squalene synthase family protein n=1 Tax=Streptacidiphilus rugosus TaxID=405783 RepID=UPI0005605C86|nr:squalene/phytoene synthase family protein [Streptacidiphilus rugosus]